MLDGVAREPHAPPISASRVPTSSQELSWCQKLSLKPLDEKRSEGSYAKLIQLPLYLFPIKGTLNERTCLPGLAATRADGMRRFRVVSWIE